MMCPYEENLGCPYVDTAVMDKTTTCQECEHYVSNKIPTGAISVSGWAIKSLRASTPEEDMEDHNNFMMGL